MATYPAALPSIPDDGTWNHAQVAREVEAIATELGVNPSGAQTDVAGRFTTVEGRVTAVEGATSVAGVEVASAQLTTDYGINVQTSNTTWTDVGLSVAVGAQTRAYNLTFGGTIIIATNSSFVGPKMAGASLRIVDSGVTVVADVTSVPLVIPVSGTQSGLFAKAWLLGRIPAGQAATTWKVQARCSPAPDTNITSIAIYAGTALGTPIAGVSRNPAQLQAITV